MTYFGISWKILKISSKNINYVKNLNIILLTVVLALFPSVELFVPINSIFHYKYCVVHLYIYRVYRYVFAKPELNVAKFVAFYLIHSMNIVYFFRFPNIYLIFEIVIGIQKLVFYYPNKFDQLRMLNYPNYLKKFI